MSRSVEFRYVEVPAGGSDSIRVGLGFDARGVPAELVIAVGTGHGGRWHEDRTQGLSIPASVARPLAEAILRLLDDESARAGDVACDHPGRALIDIRRARHTAGPSTAWIGDCLACGALGVLIGPLVGREPRSLTATVPSSPRSTCTTR